MYNSADSVVHEITRSCTHTLTTELFNLPLGPKAASEADQMGQTIEDFVFTDESDESMEIAIVPVSKTVVR